MARQALFCHCVRVKHVEKKLKKEEASGRTREKGKPDEQEIILFSPDYA
jgi:hypothetical protein